jgi:hypothetical protein
MVHPAALVLVIYNPSSSEILMLLSNAEKQRRHRERLQRQGLAHIQCWVTPSRAKLIKKIMAGEIYTGKRMVTSNRLVNLEAFAKRVQEAAEAVLPGKRRGLAVGRFAVGGVGKSRKRSWVFISAVWRELRNDPLCVGMSLDEFKEQLLKAHKAGLVTLRETIARSITRPTLPRCRSGLGMRTLPPLGCMIDASTDPRTPLRLRWPINWDNHESYIFALLSVKFTYPSMSVNFTDF